MILTYDKVPEQATLKLENCCCAGVLICSDHHNKISQTRGALTADISFLNVVEARSPRGASRVGFL